MRISHSAGATTSECRTQEERMRVYTSMYVVPNSQKGVRSKAQRLGRRNIITRPSLVDSTDRSFTATNAKLKENQVAVMVRAHTCLFAPELPQCVLSYDKLASYINTEYPANCAAINSPPPLLSYPPLPQPFRPGRMISLS